jgi:hypothetical protein
MTSSRLVPRLLGPPRAQAFVIPHRADAKMSNEIQRFKKHSRVTFRKLSGRRINSAAGRADFVRRSSIVTEAIASIFSRRRRETKLKAAREPLDLI